MRLALNFLEHLTILLPCGKPCVRFQRIGRNHSPSKDATCVRMASVQNEVSTSDFYRVSRFLTKMARNLPKCLGLQFGGSEKTQNSCTNSLPKTKTNSPTSSWEPLPFTCCPRYASLEDCSWRNPEASNRRLVQLAVHCTYLSCSMECHSIQDFYKRTSFGALQFQIHVQIVP